MQNSTIATTKKEIEFGLWIKKHRGLSLIPLLSYEERAGNVKIPYPPSFDTWKAEDRNKWIKKNVGNKKHIILEYPKLEVTFADVYWALPRKDQYKMCIDFIKTAIVMANNGFYNPDIHPKNIMRKGDKWYMIDYGEIKTNPNAYFNTLFSIYVTFSPWPNGAIFPDEHKPQFDDWKEIIRPRLLQTEFYKAHKNRFTDISRNNKLELIMELMWLIDPPQAMEISGYNKWLKTQPRHIIEKFSKMYDNHLTVQDSVYFIENIANPKLILRRLKNSLAGLNALY